MVYQFQHFGNSEHFQKDYSKSYSCPTHLHQSFEFLATLSGKIAVTVDGTEYTIEKGQAALVFPHQLHSINGDEGEHMVIIFSPEIVKAFFSSVTDSIPKSNKFSLSEHLLSALNNLNKNSSIIKKKGLLYCLCDEFDVQTTYISKHKTDKNLIYRIFEFVEHNYNKDCSLETLAKGTSFSYCYLSRYFKNTVGISFNGYVNRLRINNACYLLTNSDISIMQCALDSGYGTLRSFNRNFREIMGMTPVEYRNSSVKTDFLTE